MSIAKQKSPDKGAYYFDHEQWSEKVAYHRGEQGAHGAKSCQELAPDCYHPQDLMLFCIMEMLKQIVFMLAKDEAAAEEYALWSSIFERALEIKAITPPIVSQAPDAPVKRREITGEDPYATIRALSSELYELRSIKSQFKTELKEVVS